MGLYILPRYKRNAITPPALSWPLNARRAPYPSTRQVPIATMTSTIGESFAFMLRASSGHGSAANNSESPLTPDGRTILTGDLEPRWSPDSALIRFPSHSETTGPNLFCRRARFAFVSLRPVVLDLGV